MLLNIWTSYCIRITVEEAEEAYDECEEIITAQQEDNPHLLLDPVNCVTILEEGDVGFMDNWMKAFVLINSFINIGDITNVK